MTQTASSSWPGVRDLVNGIIYGKDPQYGLTGTAYQEVSNALRDLSKDHPFAKEHAGKLLQDAAGFVGEASGLVPLQVGKSARFLHDVKTGQEHPRGAWSWLTGMRFGTTKGHSTSAENWWKGVAR
jgi:hypothetical protein